MITLTERFFPHKLGRNITSLRFQELRGQLIRKRESNHLSNIVELSVKYNGGYDETRYLNGR